MTLRRRAFLGTTAVLAWFSLTGMGVAPEAGVDSTLADYIRVTMAYFRPLGLLPIAVSSGQRVADVYSLPTGVLLARADRCFPGLPEPSPQPAVLPGYVEAPAATVESAFGIPDLASYRTDATAARTVSLAFRDPEVRTVAWHDLKAHWSPACGELAPILTGTAEAASDARAGPVILGTVLYARPVVRLTYTTAASAQADVKRIGQALKETPLRLPFSVTALLPAGTVEAGRTEERSLALEAEAAVPVAFAPAAFPQRPESTESPQTAGSDLPALAETVIWRPYDPIHDTGSALVLDRLVTAFIGAWWQPHHP